MRLLFAGTPRVAVPALDCLLEAAGHELVAVLTRPDAVAGRGRQPARSPIAERADAAGLEVLTPRSAKDPAFLDRLRELAPDCCPVVAYGGLVPRPALDVPEHGWVNLHFSLLPAWRGAAPVPAAIRAGDEVTGATTFRLVEELDAGPVYGAVTERIGPTDTAGALLDRLSRTGARLLADTLDAIEAGTATPRAQPVDGASLAPKITTEDARVRWDLPPHLVDRLVRACTPEPGAWTTFRGERVKLGPVVAAPQESGLEPGQVSAGKHAVHVGTARGAVRLGTVQAPGRKPADAPDWSRGAHPGAGEGFV